MQARYMEITVRFRRDFGEMQARYMEIPARSRRDVGEIHGDSVEITARCRRDTWRSRRDVGEMQARCRRDAGRCKQDAGEIRVAVLEGGPNGVKWDGGRSCGWIGGRYRWCLCLAGSGASAVRAWVAAIAGGFVGCCNSWRVRGLLQ